MAQIQITVDASTAFDDERCIKAIDAFLLGVADEAQVCQILGWEKANLERHVYALVLLALATNKVELVEEL